MKKIALVCFFLSVVVSSCFAVNKIDVVSAKLLSDTTTGAKVWTVSADPENVAWKAVDIAGDKEVAYLPRDAIKQIKSFFKPEIDIAQGYHVQPVFFAAPQSKEIKESKSVMEVYHPVVMGKYPLLPDINLSTFKESVEGMGLKILISRDKKWVTISR